MICKPLSNMQMVVFVWEVWEGKRQEGGEWRGVWKERREFSAIGQTTVLCCGLNEVYTQTGTHTLQEISDVICDGCLAISMQKCFYA